MDDVDGFFGEREESKRLFRAVLHRTEGLDGVSIRVTKSQIALSRKRGFAWLWTPDRYLKGKVAPLVVSVALPERDRSKRWKEIVEPQPGHFMHHLELWRESDVDDELAGWLRAAWQRAV